MCLAIYKPKGIIIPKKYLENAFYNNDDGAGFAIVEQDENGKDELNTCKGMFDFDKEFWPNWEPHQEKQALIHFRNASNTLTVDGKNCHPFRINDELVFIHNGYISGLPLDGDDSDTARFCEKVLKPFAKNCKPDFWLNEQFKWFINNSIGSSKLVMMDVKGRFNIFNEKDGHWKDGVWYSNFDYNYRKGAYGYGYNHNPAYHQHEEEENVQEGEIIEQKEEKETPKKEFSDITKEFTPKNLEEIDKRLEKMQKAQGV